MEETYYWVSQCIDSCTNTFQLDCCRKLIDLFQSAYKTDVVHVNLMDELRAKELSITLTV